jgi:hypothetical protein
MLFRCATLGCLALAAVLPSATAQATQVVYDNFGTLLLDEGGAPRALTGTYVEVADEVELAPGPRGFHQIEVAYLGVGFTGNETLTVELYAMDGSPTSGSFGFDTPGTVLFAGTQAVAGAPGGAVATFTDASGTVTLPEILGVGVVFGGLGSGEVSGPLLYDPPVVGTSFDDYWVLGSPSPGDPWTLMSLPGNVPANFGLRITAIPEPGSGELLLVAIAAIASLRRAMLRAGLVALALGFSSVFPGSHWRTMKL